MPNYKKEIAQAFNKILDKHQITGEPIPNPKLYGIIKSKNDDTLVVDWSKDGALLKLKQKDKYRPNAKKMHYKISDIILIRELNFKRNK